MAMHVAPLSMRPKGNQMNRKTTITTIAAASLISLVGLTLAGPLNPPSGPVVSTMKTMTDVEPRIAINATNTPSSIDSVYRITQPGSYYLTGNMQCQSNRYGIQIATNGVTIDLNGYSVLGVASSLAGIHDGGSPRSDITIRNGSVKGAGSWGVALQFSSNTRVENVLVSGCASHGIWCGSQAHIEGCTVNNCDGYGMIASDNSVITRCIATGNGTTTSDDGISVANNGLVTNCTAASNAGAGVLLGEGSRASECVANENFIGVHSFNRGAVISCSCSHNTNDGIRTAVDSQVRGCYCYGNTDDGIQVDDRCVVSGNMCSVNGPGAQGSGVYVLGNDCRVDDNQFNHNHYGVLVNNANTNNFIAKNTTTGNTVNFSVPANNNLAPVITNPGTTFTGATPWSNFAY